MSLDDLIKDDEEIVPSAADMTAHRHALQTHVRKEPRLLFEHGTYPTQYEQAADNFDGEIRGAYTNDRWNPAASLFGYSRNGGERMHSGIDIYAPQSTPLLAVANGTIRVRPMRDNEAIGNRIWLDATINGLPVRIIYGHLEGFAVGDGDVNAGTVIGYAGCSGNANYDQICTLPNACGFSASHVHLSMIRKADQVFINPAQFLTLRLRYSSDTRNIPCRELFP
ncbi:MAG: M23 family metallopeptidase [Woeseia sp.]